MSELSVCVKSCVYRVFLCPNHVTVSEQALYSNTIIKIMLVIKTNVRGEQWDLIYTVKILAARLCSKHTPRYSSAGLGMWVTGPYESSRHSEQKTRSVFLLNTTESHNNHIQMCYSPITHCRLLRGMSFSTLNRSPFVGISPWFLLGRSPDGCAALRWTELQQQQGLPRARNCACPVLHIRYCAKNLGIENWNFKLYLHKYRL